MTSIRGLWFALAVLGGCGRIGFDSSARGSVDGGPPCTVGPWGAPRRQEMLVSAIEDWEGTIHPDRRVVVYTRQQQGEAELMIATRADPSDDFGSPTPIAALNTPAAMDHDWGPAWSPDGKTLYWRHSELAGDTYLEATFDGTTFSSKRASELPAGFSWELTPDGSEVFYTTQVSTNDYDLHHATLVGASWVDDSALASFHSLGFEGWPTFDAQRQALYFESEAVAPKEISVATRAGPGAAFGPAVAVPLGVTGNGDPDLSDDGLEMMFDSDAATGPGGDHDLYIVTRSCL